jgi:hypothetical protein
MLKKIKRIVKNLFESRRSKRVLAQGVPVGMEFIELLSRLEDQCSRETASQLPAMGIKAPLCLLRIGTTLSFLDRMASCWWGCDGGDHLIEYLCGRAESQAQAALRLTNCGLYDEALSMSRGIGEIANLLYLFSVSAESLATWKSVERSERLARFSPLKVRLKLEELGEYIPVDKERYQLLSERASHVTPSTRPGAHNILGVPTIGGSFQKAGFLVCLNELALPLVFVILAATQLLSIEREQKLAALTAGKELAESIGGATIDKIDSYYENVRSTPGAADALIKLAEKIRQQQTRIRRHVADDDRLSPA